MNCGLDLFLLFVRKMGNRVQRTNRYESGEDTSSKSIFLQFKKLKEVPIELFTQDDYTSIVVDFNQIEELPNLSKYASSLTELSVASNQLTEIPEWMNKLTSLAMINFGLNKLNKIDGRLNMLHVNKLESAFSSLTNLTHILLNSNSLTSLPDLTKISKLQKLSIAQNRIPASSLKVPPSLRELEMYGNRVSSFPIALQIPNITVLDLSENCLKELSDDMLQLTNLKKLYLSCNNLSSFPKNFQNCWTSLTALKIDFNDFTHFPKEVTELKELQLFNINGNPLDEESIALANSWKTRM